MFNNAAQLRAAEYRLGSVNEEKRTAEFVISSEAPDTYGTVFLSTGWELDRYNRNPVVTFNHLDNHADPDMIIGTSEVRIDDNKNLIGVVTFEDAENNPLAEKVFRKVKSGILRGASIWAQPHEGRWGEKDAGENPDTLYFTRSELMAWSIVTVQSNPDAVARSVAGLETIKKELVPVIDEEEVTGEQRTIDNQDNEEKTLSRFEAQVLMNQNSI